MVSGCAPCIPGRYCTAAALGWAALVGLPGDSGIWGLGILGGGGVGMEQRRPMPQIRRSRVRCAQRARPVSRLMMPISCKYFSFSILLTIPIPLTPPVLFLHFGRRRYGLHHTPVPGCIASNTCAHFAFSIACIPLPPPPPPPHTDYRTQAKSFKQTDRHTHTNTAPPQPKTPPPPWGVDRAKGNSGYRQSLITAS